MRKPKLSLPGAMAVVGLVVFVITRVLNLSGFCLSQGRFLTEREIIEIGASDYLRRYLPLNYEKFEPTDRPVAFTSIDDFMSKNPDCCSVTPTGRDDGEPPLFHRLSGRFAGFARIEYKLDEAVPGEPERRVVWVAVTNCGLPWNGIYWGH
jgi:hypothetical protein